MFRQHNNEIKVIKALNIASLNNAVKYPLQLLRISFSNAASKNLFLKGFIFLASELITSIITYIGNI